MQESSNIWKIRLTITHGTKIRMILFWSFPSTEGIKLAWAVSNLYLLKLHFQYCNWKKCWIRLGRIFSHIFMPNMSFSPVCRGYFFDWQKIWATWHAAWHTIVKVIVKQADSKIWVVCSSSYAFSSTWQLSGKAKWKFISP